LAPEGGCGVAGPACEEQRLVEDGPRKGPVLHGWWARERARVCLGLG
jgi:hypothetical protein